MTEELKGLSAENRDLTRRVLLADFGPYLHGGVRLDFPDLQKLLDAAREEGRRASNPPPEQGGEWVLVPREPTEAMVHAHFRAHAQAETVFADVPTLWAAILAAAPPSPEQGLGSCSASPGVGENVLSDAVQDAGLTLYRAGYYDGFADALYSEDEAEAHSKIDSVAVADGWANHRDSFFAALSTAVSPTPANAVHDLKASPEHAALVEEARAMVAKGNFAQDVGSPHYRDMIRRLALALGGGLGACSSERAAIPQEARPASGAPR